LAGQIISPNPILTLRESIAEAAPQGLPRMAPLTLHWHLKVMLVTRKRVQVFHGMRNVQATKNDRILCCLWVLANQHDEWIYIDKFEFQIGIQ
jgi:hypothetical protein